MKQQETKRRKSVLVMHVVVGKDLNAKLLEE